MPKPSKSEPVSPSIRYSDELFAQVLERLKAGETITGICKGPGMPSRQAIYLRAAKDPEGYGVQLRAAQAEGPANRERVPKKSTAKTLKLRDIRRPPVEHSDEKFDLVLARIADGSSLTEACATQGMPSPSAVKRRAVRDPDGYGAQFHEANRIRFVSLIEDVLEIADDDKEDVTVDAKGTAKVNTAAVQRARLRIDTRLTLAAKIDPGRWGETQRIDMRQVSLGVDLSKIAPNLTDDQLSRIAAGEHIAVVLGTRSGREVSSLPPDPPS